MDKNALTEKRRETVVSLLKNMDIKKDDEGGFDRDDVYDCMQQLCDLYEKNIEELQNTYENEIVSLKERYAKYDENNELYVSLIMEAKKSSNEIINQAKSEVETILDEGKEQIAQQEEELKLLYDGVETEKAAINEELNASRRAVEAEKLAMQADVDAEREKCLALKNKYSQQMLSIEEEFMDIKTNILRTAGKIDSVKTKLDDETGYSWDLSPEDLDVSFPEADVEVEDILPIAEDVPEVDVEVASEVVAEDIPEDIEIPEVAEEVEPSVEAEVEIPETEEIAEDIPAEVEAESDAVAEEVEESDLNLEDIFAEIPAAEPVEEVADEIPVAEVSEEVPTVEETADEAVESDEEINFDDIDFSSIDDDDEIEEISFEGLENLFKED